MSDGKGGFGGRKRRRKIGWREGKSGKSEAAYERGQLTRSTGKAEKLGEKAGREKSDKRRRAKTVCKKRAAA